MGGRSFLGLAFVGVALGCGAIVGIEDTTDEPATDGGDDAATIEPDANASGPPDAAPGVEEIPASEDAGTVADVSDIDAQVTTCAEPGLVARWKIDEGSGDVVLDCSGHGLHGKITNGTWSTNGADGGALALDGKSWIGFANPPLLSITSAITMTAWIRADRQTSGTEYIIGKTSNAGVNGWRLALIGSPRELAFATPTASGPFNVVGGKVPIGVWKHVAALFDPGKHSEVYLDGVRVGVHASGTPSATIPSNKEARVGARFDDLYGLTGAVSDVRVYARALDAAEIAKLAQTR